MRGDQQDILLRLKDLLPRRWFPDESPLLDSVLSGGAWAWNWAYGLIAFVRSQTRIGTAQGIWLDVIANDYFGSRLRRHEDQGDIAYRRRILLELVRERGTRRAVQAALSDLTGQAPIVFEPANTNDTGGYGSVGVTVTGIAYCAAGGWGNLNLPFQFFVTARRPVAAGIASVSGWGNFGGAYGCGALEYVSLARMQDQVTDADILTAITDVLPITSVAWTRITGQ